jgi:phage FluMu protein Com
MNHCRASSDWTCDYPECGCALTHSDPPEEKRNVNGTFCPSCGKILYKAFNTAEVYDLQIKCKECKNTFHIHSEKGRLIMKVIDV